MSAAVTSRPTLKFDMPAAVTRAMPVVLHPARLLTLDPDHGASQLTRRRRVWELSRHLHCSIVGTCLSSRELRQVLVKTGRTLDGATEHELHGIGVLAAGRNDIEGKLLNKALEQRNRQAVVAFNKSRTEAEILALWREAAKRGDIPGAYWAALTHAAATDALVRIVFGEVHMLSHLMGAANRADIRRLSALEAENAALRATIERQQGQLAHGLVKRDVRIAELTRLLEDQLAGPPSGSALRADTTDALSSLATDQARRLDSERRRRQALEHRVHALNGKVADVSRELARKDELLDRLQQELAALEACFDGASSRDADGSAAPQLAELTLLYVGGRAGSVPHLRKLAECFGAALLSHDGGLEERSGLLSGLVARADVVLFPVDCVSHEAAASIKRACRQLSKPFIPLRSSGISSFVASLRQVKRDSIIVA